MRTESRYRLGVEINPHVFGGAEAFLRNLFGHLDRGRFEPVAFAAAHGRWRDDFNDFETHVIPAVDADGAPADVAGALAALRLDLVQSSYFSQSTAIAAAQARIPHLWRVGGHVDALERQWAEQDKNRLLSIIKLTSRRVVCPSAFLRSQFNAVGVDGIDVIYSGVDLTAFPPPCAAEEAEGLSVAMVAHLVPQKRHEVFLRAAARVSRALPDARFYIFGGRYPRPEFLTYEESLHALATNLGIANVVEFRELRGERFDVLRRIDVITLPGLHEGASNAILEAMSLRKPVVAARSGGNAELVEDQVTGILVEPDAPEPLAAALVDLLRNPQRRTTMGDAGRSRVEQHFDIRDCARRYEALYHRVLTDA